MFMFVFVSSTTRCRAINARDMYKTNSSNATPNDIYEKTRNKTQSNTYTGGSSTVPRVQMMFELEKVERAYKYNRHTHT